MPPLVRLGRGLVTTRRPSPRAAPSRRRRPAPARARHRVTSQRPAQVRRGAGGCGARVQRALPISQSHSPAGPLMPSPRHRWPQRRLGARAHLGKEAALLEPRHRRRLARVLVLEREPATSYHDPTPSREHKQLKAKSCSARPKSRPLSGVT